MEKIHFLGVGGAGTSAAAALIKKSGFDISGCDEDKDSIYLPELKKLGIRIDTTHSPHHLSDVTLIVYSSAIDKVNSQNPEIIEAKKRNIRSLSTEDFVVEYLIKDKFLIAVAGTHGKSTTTAMIGQIFEDAGLDPTVYVGSIVTKWEANYRFGEGNYFILEADEYQDKFLKYHPKIGVVTNIEYDHPDYFKNEEQVMESFINFVKGFKEESKLLLVADDKDKNIKKLTEETKSLTSIMKQYDPKSFDLNLKVIGKHNLLNAQVASLAGKAIGIDKSQIKKSLDSFLGISRRFEFKGEVAGVKIFDDYAHHPTEVVVTLFAAREKFPKEKIWCVFQPHTYSRTRALFSDFVSSFKNADVDEIIIVDIFASREKDTLGVSSLELAQKIKGAKYIGNIEDAATHLVNNVSSGDVVIVMGAGDIYTLSKLLINKLEKQ
ncbi:UDP-N-acetylmuramate--L-alanine ligase [Patescibacteria group bacterium]|nr:UDP-N-acetylmuramate--L-alanine ligase [Patescibacteria group bacterium]